MLLLRKNHLYKLLLFSQVSIVMKYYFPPAQLSQMKKIIFLSLPKKLPKTFFSAVKNF
jgi:hypothetical protein